MLFSTGRGSELPSLLPGEDSVWPMQPLNRMGITPPGLLHAVNPVPIARCIVIVRCFCAGRGSELPSLLPSEDSVVPMQPLNFSRRLDAEEEEFKRLLYVPTGEGVV